MIGESGRDALDAVRRDTSAFFAEAIAADPTLARRRRLGAGTSDQAREWQQRLIENGLTCRTVPKEFGGGGLEPDMRISRVIGEEVAKAGVPGGMANQGISMLVPTLLEHGSEEQKKRFVRDTIYGNIVWCQGYSEPGAGSDLAAIRTKAARNGDEYVVNGQKIWTSTARTADWMFLLCRTSDESSRHGGLSYILLSMQTPGIEVRPLVTMTGSAEFNEVFFDDVRVPVSHVVGKEGEGWRVANSTLKHERAMLGDPFAARAQYSELEDLFAVLETSAYQKMEFRNRLLRLGARLAALTANEEAGFEHAARGETRHLSVLITKLYGCEFNHQMAQLALDMLGSDAIERSEVSGIWHWRHMFTLGLIIGGGTALIQKNIIAERGLGMPRGGGFSGS